MKITDLAITRIIGEASQGVSVTNTERFSMERVNIDQVATWGVFITNTYWVELDWVTATRCGTVGASSATGGAFFDDNVNLLLVKDAACSTRTFKVRRILRRRPGSQLRQHRLHV